MKTLLDLAQVPNILFVEGLGIVLVLDYELQHERVSAQILFMIQLDSDVLNKDVILFLIKESESRNAAEQSVQQLS